MVVTRLNTVLMHPRDHVHSNQSFSTMRLSASIQLLGEHRAYFSCQFHYFTHAVGGNSYIAINVRAPIKGSYCLIVVVNYIIYVWEEFKEAENVNEEKMTDEGVQPQKAKAEKLLSHELRYQEKCT